MFDHAKASFGVPSDFDFVERRSLTHMHPAMAAFVENVRVIGGMNVDHALHVQICVVNYNHAILRIVYVT